MFVTGSVVKVFGENVINDRNVVGILMKKNLGG